MLSPKYRHIFERGQECFPSNYKAKLLSAKYGHGPCVFPHRLAGFRKSSRCRKRVKHVILSIDGELF